MLLMLEDNAERVQRFNEALRAIAPALPLMVWRDARAMVREAGRYLPAARLISLDHDLELLDGGPDPGDGLEVVKFLVAQPLVLPSSSTPATASGQTGWPVSSNWRVGRSGG
jgi:hypothetical protein